MRTIRPRRLVMSESLELRLLLSSYTLNQSLSFNGDNGDEPQGPTNLVMDSGGDIFGVAPYDGTQGGGPNGNGLIFEVAENSDEIVGHASFAGGTSGYLPGGEIFMDSSGNLWGGAAGGTSGDGIVYGVAANDSSVQVQGDMDGDNGAYPDSIVVDSVSRDIFGTAQTGTTTGSGDLFELTEGAVAPLVTFGPGTGYGDEPQGLTQDSNGNLFGLTLGGGAGQNDGGTLWEWPETGSGFDLLATFTLQQGNDPLPGMAIDPTNGNVFGVAHSGGANDAGSIWEWVNGSDSITPLYSFTDDQGVPFGGVIEDGQGNLYGTVATGNSYADGFVWELAYPYADNTPTPIFTFNGSNGDDPESQLLMDSNGNIWGTTYAGGTYDQGTVFELSPTQGGPVSTQLQFSQQPNSTTVANPFNPDVSVDVEDVDGDTVAGDDSAVTLSITGNPAGVSLDGTVTVDADNGVATFPGVSVSAVGTYTLTATDAALTAAVSHSFTISTTPVYDGVLVPSFVKSTVPAEVVGGVTFHSSVSVELTNTSAALVNGPVTVEIFASLGGNIVDPDAPLATFTHSRKIPTTKPGEVQLQIKSVPADLAGQTYTLVAQATDPSGNLNISSTGPSVTVEVPYIALLESVVKLTLPSSMVSGGAINATEVLQITNTGDIVATGPVNIEVFASDDGSTNDGIYKSLPHHLNLRSGALTKVFVPLRTVPAGLDGSYVTIADVTDPDGNITSVNSNQNEVIEPPFVTLAAAVTAVTPGSVKPGHGATMTITVTNNGDVNSYSPLNIVLGLSNDDVTQTAVLLNKSPSLKIKPSHSLVLHLHFVAGSSLLTGQYWPTVTVTDADGNTSGLQIGALILTLD